MVVGIDIGSTTTKAVSVEGNDILCRIKTKAIDPVTSATGIIGKLTLENGLDIKDIERLVITGVGAARITKDVFNIPTRRIDEISAIGKGGLFITRKDKLIISNIGTGTVFIEATRDRIEHIGGTGVGGGTIVGLSKALLNTTDFNNIMELAGRGNLKQVDLLIEDIVGSRISFLNTDATAANFGKMLDTSKKEDVAAGIINMAYQVIGMLSVFAAKGRGYSSVAITGNGSRNKLGQRILADITKMYNVAFEYPADAEYTTAIGAALAV